MTQTGFNASSLERGISYHDKDFALVKKLIHQRTGIWLGENKQEMVYGRLSRIIREEKLTDASSYLDRLQKSNDPDMWQGFINALTTNLTAFFRERHHFDTLKTFLEERKGLPIRIWCTAASTGEEPYSIAMVAREALGPQANCQILASDIDTQALSKAKQGVYPVAAIKGVPDHYLKSTFQRGEGKNQGMVRVKPEIKEMITFEQINLIDTLPTSTKYDIIFCRNVMIYFNEDTQRSILKHFSNVIKSDGLLFAGHSENFSFISKEFSLKGSTVYQLANKE